MLLGMLHAAWLVLELCYGQLTFHCGGQVNFAFISHAPLDLRCGADFAALMRVESLLLGQPASSQQPAGDSSAGTPL